MIDPKDIHPQGDRVLLRRAGHVRTTKSGLVIVGGKNNDCQISEVLARGPDVKARKWELNVGDFVIHTRVAGVKYDGDEAVAMGEGKLVFLREDECIAVVPPEMVDNVEVGGFKYNEQGIAETGKL